MRKIRMICIAVAITLSVGGAFAKKAASCFACTNFPQYWYDGANYLTASQYGVIYYCEDEPGVCTWYKPNPFQPNYYAPCREGRYEWVE
jgi:hypothetical protein